MSTDKERFMLAAIELALEAERDGEVPVGAVITLGRKIIATGRNRRETEKSAICHAETEAINNACKALGGWRLFECEMFVTLEPCPMCAGAAVNARLKKITFGSFDKKNGAFGSAADLSVGFTHRPLIEGGFMEKECTELLTRFFAGIREGKDGKNTDIAGSEKLFLIPEKDLSEKGLYITGAKKGTVSYEITVKDAAEAALSAEELSHFEEKLASFIKSSEYADSIIHFAPTVSGKSFVFITAGLTHAKVRGFLENAFAFAARDDVIKSTALCMAEMIGRTTTEDMV